LLNGYEEIKEQLAQTQEQLFSFLHSIYFCLTLPFFFRSEFGLNLAHSFDFAQLRDICKVSNSYFYSPLQILYILNFYVVCFLWFMI
jgi:hypothetical protein